MRVLNKAGLALAKHVTIPAIILNAAGATDVKELKLGQKADASTLVLDQGYAVRMGNGGLAITKLMFGKEPVSVQLHAQELRAIKAFIR